MAMLPESMRTSAAYLGGGIARGLEQRGSLLSSMGQQLANTGSSAPVKEKVGQFLQAVGQPVQNFAGMVGKKGGMSKRDLGLVAESLAVGGAFVGGMGATAGANALTNFFAQNTLGRRSEIGAVGSSPMPQDLQTGYIALNTYGSPLTGMNIAHLGNVRASQLKQRLLANALSASVSSGAGPVGIDTMEAVKRG
jgi:hypothetical protein